MSIKRLLDEGEIDNEGLCHIIYHLITIIYVVDIKKLTKEFNSALPNNDSSLISTKSIIAKKQQLCQV